MNIAIGADHGGFELKEALKVYLSAKNMNVTDVGTFGKESVDYPEYAYKVASKVANGEAQFGIMIDGAGIGSAMTANKVPGVRAAACYDVSGAKNAREHNDANVLTLGAGFTGLALAQQIVDVFLTHSCTVDRHKRRVDLIRKIEQGKFIEANNKNKYTGDSGMNNITNEDLEKIVNKVTELLKGQDRPAAHGEACNNEMICKCGVHVAKTESSLRHFMEIGVDRFGYNDKHGGDCVPEDIARCIDHTILKPDATEQDIKKLCEEAAEYQFASVCVSPSYVPLAAKMLKNSPVKVCTVVGFPSGAHMPEIKALETRRAIRDGATEIDMVINIGALKSKNYDLVYRDIRSVVEACEDGSAICKVIIETAYLTDEEKIKACELAKKARAHYVKTSTGFAPGGATEKDVYLMKKVVGDAGIRVKASAGIRDYETAKRMIEAGADRIGASAGIKIVQGAKGVTISS
ncbi:MAG: hypothetical protein Kow00108_20290 [Calditrichia bacterium]